MTNLSLVAVVAKKWLTFSTAGPQLPTYLEIMRHLRETEGKKNIAVQGFYTDGLHYVFMAIRSDGTIEKLRILEIMNPGNRKAIFNFTPAVPS